MAQCRLSGKVYCCPSLKVLLRRRRSYCYTYHFIKVFVLGKKNVAVNNEQARFDSLLFVIFIINGRAGVVQSSVHGSDFSDCVPLIFGGGISV